MISTLKITAMEKNKDNFYPLVWVYKKELLQDETDLEIIEIDTTHNVYRTTLTKDSFLKNYDIVTRNEYEKIEVYIKNIELDGVMIFNIEDYPFLLKE